MKSVLESLTGSIADFIVAIFSFIFLLIDSVVYAIVGWAYEIFTLIAGARVLDESALRDLADRIYIVIGVVALFIVAYALLQAIIDPDKASKGDTSLGKIVPNIAIAICGIAIVPTVFNYAYDVQRMILCNNIIPKLLLDNSITYDENGYYKSERTGAEMATLLFESFFYPKNDNGEYANVSNEEGYIKMLHDTAGNFTGGDLGKAYEKAKEGGWFFTTFAPFIDDIAKDNVGYLIIISTLAGGFCAYVLIGYCFDAALRSVKLAYLEVLAPLPLLLLIVPGQKKVFQNWLKKTTSCFFEIFVRIFAIVFAAFIMRHLPDLIFNMSSMFNGGYGCLTNPNFIVMLLIRAILIAALFAFMKQAPKLISEITGIDSKGFKIGIGDKLAETGVFQAMAGLGGLGAATVNGAVGAGRVLGDSFQSLRNGNFGAAAKTLGKGALRGVAGIPRKYTSAYYSYKNAKNAKNMDEVGQAISKGTAQGMSAPGFMESAIDNIKERANKIKNTVAADYEPYNSASELRKAAEMDEIKKKIDEIKTLADTKQAGKIQDLEKVYDAEVKRAQEEFSRTGNSENLATALENARKAFNTGKRKLEYEAITKEGDKEFEVKRKELAALFARSPEVVKEAAFIGGHVDKKGNAQDAYGTKLNDNQFVENIQNGTIFSDVDNGKSTIFEIGSNLGSASSYIRTQAMEQENKQKDK